MSDSSDEDVGELQDQQEYSEDEVLPSDYSDSDDDSLEEDPRFKRFQIELKKDEMASDIESENEEDYLPDSQAWGSNKQLFYNTDYVDKDFRSQKSKDEDLAKYEEEEALEIQKRLLDSVNEADLGIDLLIDDSRQKRPAEDSELLSELKKKSKVTLDLDSLSESQKASILKKESPEIEFLIADFRKYMLELKDTLEPLLQALIANQSPSTLGLQYLKLRHTLLTNYCTNISLYLAMKCDSHRTILKDHPIIKQLLLHKKIATQLDSVGAKTEFIAELNQLRQAVGRPIEFAKLELENFEEDIAPEPEVVAETVPEVAKVDIEMSEEEKRAITYEMEKNKGLTPRRKKEQRNPRVKYRRKFENAVVRRKGQVRLPRKEVKKYAGELTGINVRAVKSVKFK